MTGGTVSDAAARVVIAADEPMVARILEHKLRREGHAVRWVLDSATLWRLLDDDGADVLLVDAGLDRGGIALMEERTRDGCLPRAGWFAIVEARDIASQQRAMHAGAVGLVVKPFRPSDVARQVATLLSLRQ